MNAEWFEQQFLIKSETRWVVRYDDTVDSTMNSARKLIDHVAGDKPGLAIAAHQSEGRGQQGRDWKHTGDSLAMTTVFSTRRDTRALLGLSLVAGCAIRRICRTYGAEVLLKWPNDILSESGDKLAGILIEIVSRDLIHYILTGCGINLLAAPELPATTCLQKEGATISDRNAFAVDVATMLYTVWEDFLLNGFSIFQQEWNEAAFALGEWITIDREDRIIEGIFEGVDEEGYLLVNLGSHRERLVSGRIQKLGDKAYAARI